MDKDTKNFRKRGINNPVFLGPSNYLGNGEHGTLENEMASKDESSITRIIDTVREGHDIKEFLPELKFLLGNNSARSPHFRRHPKVSEHGTASSEQFHRVVMDVFPDQYLEYPICVIRLQSNDNQFILPDLSLTHMVLSPDIVIMRTRKDEDAEFAEILKEDETHFARRLNEISFENCHSWVVSGSRQLLESFGGITVSKAVKVTPFARQAP
jgi:hypothetical protein